MIYFVLCIGLILALISSSSSNTLRGGARHFCKGAQEWQRCVSGGYTNKKRTLDLNNQDACQNKLQMALIKIFEERAKVF